MTSLMKSDLKRRVDKISLIQANYLMPAYEAIINSIQSIEKNEELATTQDGMIELLFDRKSKKQVQLDFQTEEELRNLPVMNVEIVDNGTGFNKINFDSFLTYDSPLKQSSGGKGTGRLLWLKAFDSAEIESYYKEEDKCYKIKFLFSIEKGGVDSDFVKIEQVPSDKFKCKTIIRLIGLKEQYQEQYSQSLQSLGKKIINHFISHFVNKEKCPKIVIKDNFESENLNSLFKDSLIKEHIEHSTFSIGKLNFNLHYVKLKPLVRGLHKLHFCADSREVYSITLKDYIPNLASKLTDKETNEDFYYQIFMSGKYLDDYVDDSNRSRFIFDDSNLLTNQNLITEEAVKNIKEHINKQLEEIEEAKYKTVKAYILKNSPQYRILLNDKYKKQLKNIPPNLKGKELDLRLYDEFYKIDREAKKKTRELLSKKPGNEDDADFLNNKLNEYIDAISEVSKAKLSDYVAYRKSVLDLLSKLQKQKNNGKYPLEKAIHEIVFPMNKTSDDIDYEKHNLWAIDERLSYHSYLASDKKFKSMDVIDSNSGKEPDIIIFNRPIVLTDNEEKINTITIIEFKRPERDDYTDDDNPLQQIINYVKDLRESKAKDKDGETITINSNTPIYAYLITSLTPKMINLANDSGYLTSSPDNSGYFGFHPRHCIYFEIISYKKMIQDSKDRNRILFDKLNL